MRENNIGILGIKVEFSGKSTSIDTLNEKTKLDGPELEYYNTCGIKSVYQAEQESSYSLAKTAAMHLLDEQGLNPESIDTIIYIQSRVPESFISSEATRLQADLGAKNAWAFSIGGLGCTDSTSALKMAVELLKANKKNKNVLIAYGNKQIAQQRFRYPVTIMGDAGVATLIGRTNNNVIQDIQIESNGKYWDLFSVNHSDALGEDYKETCKDLRTYGFELAIESKNRFTSLLHATLGKNGLNVADIQHFLMQNISARAFQYYEDALAIKINPLCSMNLSKYGHLGAADIFINYASGLDSGILEKNQNVLIMNNSPVAAWSTLLIKV